MGLIQKIKNELNRLGIKPKKGLGQNFLINEGVYQKIITAAEIKAGDTVVEVGPGLGTLTEYLAQTGAEIIAIEKDRLLASHLKTKFANSKNVRIIENDILKIVVGGQFSVVSEKTKTGNWKLETGNYKVVGNIPYYLTSHLLRTVFETWPQPEVIVLMLQKEVAQRIVAKPPRMSLLAVSVRYFSKPEIISYVSRNSFYPAPKVDSAIIKLVPELETRNQKLETNFFRVARAGFVGKRKQLGNNLARELKLTKNFVEEKLKSIGIDSMRRAETLTIEEWQKITDIFYTRD